MKTKLHSMVIVLALLVGTYRVAGQAPIIISFSQNGVLVCSNLNPGSVASVEWASSLAGPWRTNWAGLDAVTVDSNKVIQVSVPMFYRVRGVAWTNPAPITTADGMALIPAGSFTMGDTLDGESDAAPTNIYVSDFYIDTNLVSYSQWLTVYNWATNNGFQFRNSVFYGKATNNPVVAVNWYDCIAWCNARSQQAGLTPVYYADAGFTQVYMYGTTVFANWTNSGYRLPTEAEWEKAARGGLSGERFPWGNTISENQADYLGNTSLGYDFGPNGYNTNFDTGNYPYTSPVGYFTANGYGLYDMAGNVFEWCWDWYGTPYGQPTISNPTGPATGSSCVFRGGAFNYTPDSARCAYRGFASPSSASGSCGLRCVRGK